MDTSRPKGGIITVLDLADRDGQDDFFTPITSDNTFLHRKQTRTNTFTPTIQTFPYRGPATFGNTIMVDLNAADMGDLLHYIGIQIQLDHWLLNTDIYKFLAGIYSYNDPSGAWTWANSMGTVLVERAYIMIGDTTIETVDSQFASIFSALWPNINTQFGMAADAYGYAPDVTSINPNRPYPTENGQIMCLLPFWFSRTRYSESLPLLSCKDGTIKLYVKFREFADVVRQIQGFRPSCTATPLNTSLTVNTNPTAENFLQSVTTTSQVYQSDFVGNYYKIPLYSSSYQKQISNLPNTFYTIKYGISRDQYLLVPYFQLVINTPAPMSISQIAFYLVDNPVFEYLYTLPTPLTSTSATISFTNLQIISVPNDPLELQFSNVVINQNTTTQITTKSTLPGFANIEIIALTSLVDGEYREKLMRKPHEILYREIQPSYFSEPLKYTITRNGSGSLDEITTVGIPLECNGPIEEILWVIRRKGVAINNEWTNFGPLLESQIVPGRYAEELLESASLWINGVPFVEQPGHWYRTHISQKHKGGIVAYNRYMYGYSFARNPGEHQPSGTINTSKATTMQLRLTVRTPQAVTVPAGFDQSIGTGWEVFVYCMGLNWLRFENGIGNRLYSN
jgi:hypothetical protein